MKSLIAVLFSLFATASMAAEPSYTCNPERGCREERGPAYDIGRGATLTLPPGWRLFSYPTAPDPIMAGLRELRATKDGMVIAVSPVPNVGKVVFTDRQLCEFVTKSGAAYVRQSKEQVITPVPMSRGEVVGCHASFTAANEGEKPFAALANRHHASVTTFIMSYKDVLFSLTAVSEQLPDDEYRAVIKAIQEIQ